MSLSITEDSEGVVLIEGDPSSIHKLGNMLLKAAETIWGDYGNITSVYTGNVNVDDKAYWVYCKED